MQGLGGNKYCGWFKYLLVTVMILPIASCGSSTSGSGGSDDIPSDITVTFPATNTSIPLDFDFSATGSGSNLIGDINISSSEGTIVINNQTLPTLVYASIPWEEAGRNLYQGIAFSDTDLFVYWLYCSVGSNSLYKIYYESTDHYGMTQESASGTCNFQERASRPSFSLTERNVGISRLVSGYTIAGNDISLNSGQSGALTYIGTSYTFYPFEQVDCSDCSGGPWRELHSVASDASGQTACFTILYLFTDTDSVFSSYSLCLPTLDNINATLSGTWTSTAISYSTNPEFTNGTSDVGQKGIPPPQLPAFQ